MPRTDQDAPIEVGDVVQVAPGCGHLWEGCYGVVVEVNVHTYRIGFKEWRRASLQVLPAGKTYCRLVGRALEW